MHIRVGLNGGKCYSFLKKRNIFLSITSKNSGFITKICYAMELRLCCNNGIQDHQLFMLSMPGRTMLTNNKKVEGSYIEWLDEVKTSLHISTLWSLHACGPCTAQCWILDPFNHTDACDTPWQRKISFVHRTSLGRTFIVPNFQVKIRFFDCARVFLNCTV